MNTSLLKDAGFLCACMCLSVSLSVGLCVCVDAGAHNPEAARALATHIDSLRAKNQSVSVHWIMGMSSGKDVEGVVGALVRKGDVVECVAVEVCVCVCVCV